MKPHVSENVTWKNLGDSLVLLNLADASYYVLNETAALAFRGVLHGLTDQEMAESLVKEYDCSADQASADVAETLDFMIKEGLLKATAPSDVQDGENGRATEEQATNRS
jgi:Coenzyme PQQ synthesis protein D (PqqD)